ncbi:HAD hydrolase family protein [Facklamia sp. DSM 111018]|uniref:HAD hydrolase family protein n=1 Tax=Facklamia lactis TaxID=2749967 RepID=A0ABS0LQY4_9LACT|nr:HAD family hydrolase [Facklamia lactis]MBG9986564.1 HAD hydrolase family protein [Facklamia lactis]
MLRYQIPGREEIKICQLVLDYNGTIAFDGQLIEGVEELIIKLANLVKIYIVTADTYGTVAAQCEHLPVTVKTFPAENAGLEKLKIVESLDSSQTLCIGNGYNDVEMFEKAILSIAVIENEGVSSQALMASDVVTHSIIDALTLLLNHHRMRATLRN